MNRTRIARGLLVPLVAVGALLVGSAVPAAASPESVDNVINVIDENLQAGKWSLAGQNIDALEKTIYNELIVRKTPVSMASNPVDVRLAAVLQRLKDLKAEYKALSDALERAQQLSARASKQAIIDIGGELVSKLQLINGGKLAPLAAGNSHNAQVIAGDFANLRSANAAVRYLAGLRDSLIPAIREAQRDRAHLLALKARMDMVVAKYTPKGLVVGAASPTTPATPAPGVNVTGTWSTDWNSMTLSQSGSAVTGTYDHDGGRIEGTFSGNTLTGRWSEAPSYAGPMDAGTITWTFAADGKSFSGTWTYDGGGGGTWVGTRS